MQRIRTCGRLGRIALIKLQKKALYAGLSLALSLKISLSTFLEMRACRTVLHAREGCEHGGEQPFPAPAVFCPPSGRGFFAPGTRRSELTAPVKACKIGRTRYNAEV